MGLESRPRTRTELAVALYVERVHGIAYTHGVTSFFGYEKMKAI